MQLLLNLVTYTATESGQILLTCLAWPSVLKEGRALCCFDSYKERLSGIQLKRLYTIMFLNYSTVCLHNAYLASVFTFQHSSGVALKAIAYRKLQILIFLLRTLPALFVMKITLQKLPAFCCSDSLLSFSYINICHILRPFLVTSYHSENKQGFCFDFGTSAGQKSSHE